MREKTTLIFCHLLNAFILAGIIIFFIGLYYWLIKAGIPYQDPPLELQIEYTINTRIGGILIAKGFLISVCSGVIRLLFGWIRKRINKLC